MKREQIDAAVLDPLSIQEFVSHRSGCATHRSGWLPTVSPVALVATPIDGELHELGDDFWRKWVNLFRYRNFLALRFP